MSDRQVRVTFQPSGRAVYVLPGTTVLEAAARAGLTIETPCGGAGTCGKCRLQITCGAPPPVPADRDAFDANALTEGWRLACQTVIDGEAVVSIPESSLFGAKQQIVSGSVGTGEVELMPAVRKVFVELPPPSLADDAPDLLRLEREVGRFRMDLALLRRLPGMVRSAGFTGTAVLADHHLIDFERGDTTGRCYGLAFDVGTTTVSGALVDLCSGGELAVASEINPQVSYGDDVVSRIQRAGADPACLGTLRDAVLGLVGRMIDTMCGEAGVERTDVYEIVFAGNTTMEHLLCGVDPSQLGRLPFVPAYARGLDLSAADMGVAIHPAARAYVFPVIGGFVGGDTAAGLLATGLADRDGAVLMVDIGTNGEIVLASEGRLWAASTAAGPAFEGARISCGMRASTGAIEKVLLDEDAHLGVIGNTAPIGLCGSGLIDLAAELLRCGIVTRQGRMLSGDELPADLPEALRRRVVVGQGGEVSFVLAEAADGRAPVALTQKDVREVQLATGAIRAGLSILLARASLTCSDLALVLIAGGFGSFIRRSRAQRIGLLPADIERHHIQYVGNASLNGARWALLSTASRRRAEDLARRATHVELSMDPGFQTQFADAMIFPGPPPADDQGC